MIHTIDPGRKEQPITVLDNIVYSHVSDTEGKPLDLKLSITASFGNSEIMALRGGNIPDNVPRTRRPVMLWFNGGGWRGADKNMQLADLMYLPKAGYALVCAYYRSSAEGHFPDQIIDAKTAVRFLRANADKYSLDPERICVFGRSAGGQLSALVGINDGKYVSEEYAEYPSEVKAVYDMFGPADLYEMAKEHLEWEEAGVLFEKTKRWNSIFDCHEGAVLGGDRETLLDRAKEFSPAWNINEKCADYLIMHGTADKLVPYSQSVSFHDKLTAAGIPAELYLLENAGHGTPEFFQPLVQQVVLEWLKEHL